MRTSIGLTGHFVDIKDATKDPSLQYVNDPHIKTKKDLEMKRREENFEEFKKSEANQGTFKNSM